MVYKSRGRSWVYLRSFQHQKIVRVYRKFWDFSTTGDAFSRTILNTRITCVLFWLRTHHLCGQNTDEELQYLKQCLMSDPILQPFNTDRDWVIMTDASGKGVLGIKFFRGGMMGSYTQLPMAVMHCPPRSGTGQ